MGFREIMLSQNKLSITDDPIWGEERSTTFINVRTTRGLLDSTSLYTFDNSTVPRELIKVYSIIMGNQGVKYDRKITSVIDESAQIGGLARVIFPTLYVFYLFLGQPFRDLDLGISY